MGFGKAMVMFVLVALFAVTAIGMAAVMNNDKPTDAYYTLPNNTAAGSSALSGTIIGAGVSIMVPMIIIAGILALFVGFTMLRKH